MVTIKRLTAFVLTLIMITSVLPLNVFAATPSQTTEKATEITEKSAVLWGYLSKDGGNKFSEYGFFYGTTSDPSIKKTVHRKTSKETTAISEGNRYSYALKGLKEGTTYYYCCYVKTTTGDVYKGAVGSFKTVTTIDPEVETLSVSEISATSAILNGKAVKNGGNILKEYGFYCGTSKNPTKRYVKGTNEGKYTAIETPKEFEYPLNGLKANTTYYYYAYVKTEKGKTVKGDVKSFTTSALTSESAKVNSIKASNSNPYILGQTTFTIKTNQSAVNGIIVYAGDYELDRVYEYSKSGSELSYKLKWKFTTEGSKLITVYPLDKNGYYIKDGKLTTTITVKSKGTCGSPSIQTQDGIQVTAGDSLNVTWKKPATPKSGIVYNVYFDDVIMSGYDQTSATSVEIPKEMLTIGSHRITVYAIASQYAQSEPSSILIKVQDSSLPETPQVNPDDWSVGSTQEPLPGDYSYVLPDNHIHDYEYSSTGIGSHHVFCNNPGCDTPQYEEGCTYDSNGKCVYCGGTKQEKLSDEDPFGGYGNPFGDEKPGSNPPNEVCAHKYSQVSKSEISRKYINKSEAYHDISIKYKYTFKCSICGDEKTEYSWDNKYCISHVNAISVLENGGEYKICSSCGYSSFNLKAETQNKAIWVDNSINKISVYRAVDKNGNPTKKYNEYIEKTDNISIYGKKGNCLLIGYTATVGSDLGEYKFRFIEDNGYVLEDNDENRLKLNLIPEAYHFYNLRPEIIKLRLDMPYYWEAFGEEYIKDKYSKYWSDVNILISSVVEDILNLNAYNDKWLIKEAIKQWLLNEINSNADQDDLSELIDILVNTTELIESISKNNKIAGSTKTTEEIAEKTTKKISEILKEYAKEFNKEFNDSKVMKDIIGGSVDFDDFCDIMSAVGVTKKTVEELTEAVYLHIVFNKYRYELQVLANNSSDIFKECLDEVFKELDESIASALAKGTLNVIESEVFDMIGDRVWEMTPVEVQVGKAIFEFVYSTFGIGDYAIQVKQAQRNVMNVFYNSKNDLVNNIDAFFRNPSNSNYWKLIDKFLAYKYTVEYCSYTIYALNEAEANTINPFTIIKNKIARGLSYDAIEEISGMKSEDQKRLNDILISMGFN